jgi:hypothetical protein
MSKAASSSAGWAGAPPVTSDGFAFANGDFYAEASGQNRHRRATPAELRTHFASGSDKDHPAHWFEAQLLHYGLKPSKTKSVARMRLYDAVNANQLKVPATISLLENSLKKEWTKMDRDAKKAADGVTKAKPPAAAEGSAKANATKTKRKRDADDQPMKPKATPAPKARRPSKKTTATPAEASQRPAKKRKPTLASRGSRAPTAQASSSAAAIPSSSSTPTRVKQTARRGGISQKGLTRQAAHDASASETSRFPTIQTARCSRGRAENLGMV